MPGLSEFSVEELQAEIERRDKEDNHDLQDLFTLLKEYYVFAEAAASTLEEAALTVVSEEFLSIEDAILEYYVPPVQKYQLENLKGLILDLSKEANNLRSYSQKFEALRAEIDPFFSENIEPDAIGEENE